MLGLVDVGVLFLFGGVFYYVGNVVGDGEFLVLGEFYLVYCY